MGNEHLPPHKPPPNSISPEFSFSLENRTMKLQRYYPLALKPDLRAGHKSIVTSKFLGNFNHYHLLIVLQEKYVKSTVDF